MYAKGAEERALDALDVCEGHRNLTSGWQELADETAYTISPLPCNGRKGFVDCHVDT